MAGQLILIPFIRAAVVDLDKPISELLAEAISDLALKHNRTEVHYSTAVPESKKGKK